MLSIFRNKDEYNPLLALLIPDEDFDPNEDEDTGFEDTEGEEDGDIPDSFFEEDQLDNEDEYPGDEWHEDNDGDGDIIDATLG